MKTIIYMAGVITFLFSMFSCTSTSDKKSSVLSPNTPRDSSHATIMINGNLWFAENLTVSAFQNGDPIAYAKSGEEWANYAERKVPAYTYCNFDSLNFSHLGKLYNWYAVDDSRGLAPLGWRIPSQSDWSMLERHCVATYVNITDIEHLENTRFATEELADSADWGYGNGTNKTGFKALPGRFVNDSGEFEEYISTTGWWSRSSDVNRAQAYGEERCENCAFCFMFSSIGHDYHNVAPMGYGLYIRCIQSD